MEFPPCPATSDNPEHLPVPHSPWLESRKLWLFLESCGNTPSSQQQQVTESCVPSVLKDRRNSWRKGFTIEFSRGLEASCECCCPFFPCRYYAICCQPLVYRNKMTPLRIAVMLGGCWVIPTFISFLPIMQGWNSIGIIDLVSSQGRTTIQCVGCWVFFKKQFSGKGEKKEKFPVPSAEGLLAFWRGSLRGVEVALSWKDWHRVAWGRILPLFTPSSVRSPWKKGQAPAGPWQHLRNPWSPRPLQLSRKKEAGLFSW